MAGNGKGKKTGKPPSEATLKDFAGALTGVAAALASNTTAEPGERRPSNEQLRTTLDYLVLSALVGRSVPRNLTVRATRIRRDGAEKVRIFKVPGRAVEVAVHAAGETRPEVIAFRNSGGQPRRRTITLDRTRGKDIARLELRDGAGRPIRLGPRLAPLPDDGSGSVS